MDFQVTGIEDLQELSSIPTGSPITVALNTATSLVFADVRQFTSYYIALSLHVVGTPTAYNYVTVQLTWQDLNGNVMYEDEYDIIADSNVNSFGAFNVRTYMQDMHHGPMFGAVIFNNGPQSVTVAGTVFSTTRSVLSQSFRSSSGQGSLSDPLAGVLYGESFSLGAGGSQTFIVAPYIGMVQSTIRNFSATNPVNVSYEYLQGNGIYVPFTVAGGAPADIRQFPIPNRQILVNLNSAAATSGQFYVVKAAQLTQ